MKRVKLTKEEAHKLLILREEKGVKIKDAACYLGIHITTVRNYERARLTIPLNVFNKMEKLYNVSLGSMGTIIEKQNHDCDIVSYSTNPFHESKIKNLRAVARILRSLDDFL